MYVCIHVYVERLAIHLQVSKAIDRERFHNIKGKITFIRTVHVHKSTNLFSQLELG